MLNIWFYKLSRVPPSPQFYYSCKMFFCFFMLTSEIWGGWHMIIYKKSGKLRQGSTGLDGMILGWFELSLAYGPLSADTPLLKVTVSLIVKSGDFSSAVIFQGFCWSYPSNTLIPDSSFSWPVFLPLLCWVLSFSHSNLLKCFILYRMKFKRPPRKALTLK